jgi:serine-type D-Ala-D-Ala carboxypeptidase/endopeptidase (penicillin-binding protein 4)
MQPLRRLVLVAVAWTAVTAAPAHALGAPTVARSLARESAKLGAASGAYVVDQATGRVLFSRRPDLALVPASNEKLYTTATALLTLGPTARRQTKVIATGPAGTDPATPTTPTDLYLVGAGDPTLSDAGLAQLADQLVDEQGIERVQGGVVGDETLMDARRGSYDSNFAADLDLGGQLGALVVGHGATDAKGPAHVAAARLQALLKKRGVRFGRAATTGVAPADPSVAALIATEESPPVSELIRATNQPSDNFYAELLLKVVGATDGGAGTTAAGASVVRRTLAPLGVKPVVVDGSGLSRANRTSSRQVATLLAAMARGPVATPWLASLPVAGRNGTLRKRMRGTAAAGRCRGKTGTLRGVSALSGYCTTATGTRVVFSFLENGVGPGAKLLEDRMVVALARYSG